MTDSGRRLVPAAALIGLAAPAVVAWSTLLGGFAVAVVPVAVLAAPALAGRQTARRAAGALAVWLVAAPLLAGVPADQLEPGGWRALPGRLLGGVLALSAPAPAATGAAGDPWPLAGGLLLAGAAWIAAAALARRSTGMALAAGAAPWLAAAVLHPAHTAVWQGAAVVLAGLVWHAWPRTPARAAVALSVVVALLSGITAAAIAPRHRWFDLLGSGGRAEGGFRLLQTEPTFERLVDRRSGAPMLEIEAAEPAFWRVQVLDVFNGHGWRTSRSPPSLPEPAARPVRVDVRVRGLRNDLVASPGAIERVAWRGSAHAGAGGAWRLAPRPQMGDEYRVDARVVTADAAELRRAVLPRDPRVAAYTRLGWSDRRSRRGPTVVQFGPLTLVFKADPEPRGFPIDVPLFGDPRNASATAALDASPYRGVGALARRLASGARTEWQVVARVMGYLRDADRFRYTTEVGRPGRFPLVDFLLRTHAGYCQHFAGAAALLLRLAGVPARMVSGFATGVRSDGRYRVRDVDAHDWIEVYFAGYGWVPLNPTPAASPAAIAPALDLFATTGGRPRLLDSRAYAIAGVLAALMLAGWRRRRRPQLGDALARLLGTPVLPSTTLGELADQLARALGPHTAALATEAERARFGRQGAVRQRWTSARIARAVARDVGSRRALVLLARPTPGSAAAGARASHDAAQGDLA